MKGTNIMKHIFSRPSKSKPKGTASADENCAADDGNKKEFVTECDRSKTLADVKHKYVIAPIENTWWPHKILKNLKPPLQSAAITGSGLEFESEVPLGDSQGSDNIIYGLNLRQKAKNEQLLLQSLRKDLESIADDPTLEDYESVPVEGFGAALLAGYGWKPGQGIGKNPKQDVQVKEFKSWNAQGEGLGFDPDRSRVSDTKAENGKLEKPRDVNGGDFVGKEVRIVGGREIGLKGKTVEKLGTDLLGLNLSGSERQVKLGVNEAADVGSLEEDKCLQTLKVLQVNDKEKDLGFRSRASDTKAQGEENGKLEKPRDVDGGDFVGKEVRIVGGREIGLKGKIVEKLGTDLLGLNLSGSERQVKVGLNEVADLGSLEEEKKLL